MTTLLRVEEAAHRLGISRVMGYRLIQAGYLKSVQVSPRRVAVREEDLDAYIAAGGCNASKPKPVKATKIDRRRRYAIEAAQKEKAHVSKKANPIPRSSAGRVRTNEPSGKAKRAVRAVNVQRNKQKRVAGT